MITERIRAMMAACEDGQPSFPPTVLYSEGWLLRVVLDWYARHGGDRYPLSPLPGARWFSEAWLPSAFLPRWRGDHLGEMRTRADGIVGHFRIGDPGASGLTLRDDARQLVLIEAKLHNGLSAGVKNAPYYDQAARTVACAAEVLRRADRRPESLDDLSFLILAPQARIDDGVFARPTADASLHARVLRRAEAYEGDRDDWFRDWFAPTLARIDVRCLAWEEVIEMIAFHCPTTGQLVDSFYGRCLHFNRRRELSAYPGRTHRARRPGPPPPPRPAPPTFEPAAYSPILGPIPPLLPLRID